MSTEHWKRIPDSDVRHIWRGENGQIAVVDPTFYAESGTPIDEEGEDMKYVETQIRVSP